MVASLLVGVVGACGGNHASSPSGTGAQSSISQMPASSAPAAPAATEIVISDFAYSVPPSVSPGQQVTVVNKDGANHTVTADTNNLFDVRVSGGGGTATFTAPATPGSYPFHCKYHDNMHGSLTVQ